MLPTYALLRARLRGVVKDKCAQGHDVSGLTDEIDALPDSYDAMAAMAQRLADLPLRDGWPYVEPDDLAGINAEADPGRPTQPLATTNPPDNTETAARIEQAFTASVVGCMLGKPLEFDPTLDDLKRILEPLGEWPLADYVPKAIEPHIPYTLPHWDELSREALGHVVPDDDINYTVLGMLVLERHGADFTRDDLWRLWVEQLPPGQTWGPERTTLIKAATTTLEAEAEAQQTPDQWVTLLNPGDELCGALIRVDAYGYACPGDPAAAAALAHRDAGLTHRRTGVYAAMWLAAALATAPVTGTEDRLAPFETALQFVPQRSRFAETVRTQLDDVKQAADWLDGYRRIHARHAEHRHCAIHQEVGLLMNTMRFAESVGDGVCKQVMQGCDTDSFGARAGSLLGLAFDPDGPGGLEDRWTAPFNDDFRVGLGLFWERSLTKVAARMARLPSLLSR